jgi:hypothetical protein
MSKLKKSPIELSLTDFVDFVCKAGKSKLTKVKQIKGREEYSPATDFYKGLREGIIKNHEDGGTKKDLTNIIDGLTDPKKLRNYSEAINGYKKYWGRKTITFFNPPFKHWKVGDVDVRINPELGLEYDDKYFVVKLYLKNDKLSKDKIDQILTLMESQLRKKVEPEISMAVIDVKNAKFFVKEDDDLTLLPLLDGEVRSFETIWNSIK